MLIPDVKTVSFSLPLPLSLSLSLSSSDITLLLFSLFSSFFGLFSLLICQYWLAIEKKAHTREGLSSPKLRKKHPILLQFFPDAHFFSTPLKCIRESICFILNALTMTGKAFLCTSFILSQMHVSRVRKRQNTYLSNAASCWQCAA